VGARPLGAREPSVRVGELLALVAAPPAFLTALLYYFGWVRENAVFNYFGVDADLIGFTTQGYLLRSAGIAFRPLAIGLLLAGGLLVVHVSLRHLITTTRRRSRLLVAASGVMSVGLLLVASLVMAGKLPVRPLLGALALGFGALTGEVAAYDLTVWPARIGAAATRRTVALRRMIVASLVLVAAFWSTALYAQHSGESFATYTGANLASLPAIVLFSEKQQQISGPGVQVMALDPTDSAFRFQYTGLRLLVYGGGRWFILPDGWVRGNGATVTILPDADRSVRVAIQAPSRHP